MQFKILPLIGNNACVFPSRFATSPFKALSPSTIINSASSRFLVKQSSSFVGSEINFLFLTPALLIFSLAFCAASLAFLATSALSIIILASLGFALSQSTNSLLITELIRVLSRSTTFVFVWLSYLTFVVFLLNT